MYVALVDDRIVAKHFDQSAVGEIASDVPIRCVQHTEAREGRLDKEVGLVGCERPRNGDVAHASARFCKRPAVQVRMVGEQPRFMAF